MIYTYVLSTVDPLMLILTEQDVLLLLCTCLSISLYTYIYPCIYYCINYVCLLFGAMNLLCIAKLVPH